MTTTELAVPTVHCQSCKLNIEESLDELAGVTRAEVDLDAKRVSVDYDPDRLDPAAVATAIEAAGYPTEPGD